MISQITPAELRLQARHVDRGLGMAGTHQNAAGLGRNGKTWPGVAMSAAPFERR
ncbi:hypothetical protein R2601_07771, partial [Salipiger bermudensis HTCC2601]